MAVLIIISVRAIAVLVESPEDYIKTIIAKDQYFRRLTTLLTRGFFSAKDSSLSLVRLADNDALNKKIKKIRFHFLLSTRPRNANCKHQENCVSNLKK